MTARDALDGMKAQMAADQSKTVHDAKFGDVLRTGWCTYYFGADSNWHNARTGEVIQDLEALEDERQADDEVSVWLTTPTDAARLIGAVEAVLARMDEWDSYKAWPDAEETQVWYSAGKRHASEAIRALITEALEEAQ